MSSLEGFVWRSGAGGALAPGHPAAEPGHFPITLPTRHAAAEAAQRGSTNKTMNSYQ